MGIPEYILATKVMSWADQDQQITSIPIDRNS